MACCRPANGFIVEAFVRTPVSLKVFFKYNFKLEKILIDAKVNRHETNGFQIFTSIDREKPYFRRVCQLTNTSKKSHEYVFEKRKQIVVDDTESKMNRAYFGACPLAYIENVCVVNIVITQTLNSTSPCMKSLKIIGLIPKTLVLDVPHQIPVSLNPPEVPKEFIDELTNELMRVPIEMPSGKKIDKTTFDTYLKIQRQNGIFKQTDPFTGIEVGSTHTIRVHDELKAKIDRFRLQTNIAPSSPTQSALVDTLKRKLPISFHESGESDGQDRPLTSKRCLSDKPADSTKKCFCCQNESQNLYEIEMCKHAYCRHCLISIKNVCVLCKTKFDSRHVVHLYRERFCRQYKAIATDN